MQVFVEEKMVTYLFKNLDSLTELTCGEVKTDGRDAKLNELND